MKVNRITVRCFDKDREIFFTEKKLKKSIRMNIYMNKISILLRNNG